MTFVLFGLKWLFAYLTYTSVLLLRIALFLFVFALLFGFCILFTFYHVPNVISASCSSVVLLVIAAGHIWEPVCLSFKLTYALFNSHCSALLTGSRLTISRSLL